jgi:hypothetical protein
VHPTHREIPPHHLPKRVRKPHHLVHDRQALWELAGPPQHRVRLVRLHVAEHALGEEERGGRGVEDAEGVERGEGGGGAEVGGEEGVVGGGEAGAGVGDCVWTGGGGV